MSRNVTVPGGAGSYCPPRYTVGGGDCFVSPQHEAGVRDRIARELAERIKEALAKEKALVAKLRKPGRG